MKKSEKPVLAFQKEDPEARIPFYATEGAAGADLHAILRDADGSILEDGLLLQPFQQIVIGTGLRADIPSGYEVQIRPRSGLAAKYGVTVLNSPGTLDTDFKGEWKVVLILLRNEPFRIHHLDRVAQMVIAPVSQARFTEVRRVGNSARGEGGFGSTGL